MRSVKPPLLDPPRKRAGDPQLPGAVWLTLTLLALAFTAGAASLVMQGRETKAADQANAIALTGGDPDAGQAAVARLGCGACHEIPGVANAQGRVGPSLDKVAVRAFIGGALANRPQTMIDFVARPEHMQPQGAMPTQPMSSAEARDIAAYLYTLR